MTECETRFSQHCSSGMLCHLATYMKSSRYTMQTTPELYCTCTVSRHSPQNHSVPSTQQQPRFGTV